MKTLVITPGDPEGIGPEVTAKALIKLKKKLKPYSIVVFASKKSFGRNLKLLKGLNLFFPDLPVRKDPGFISGWAIEQAAKTVLASPKNTALITGPISKFRLQEAGFPFQGHTDYLASLCGTKDPTMMLMNSKIRVALVTQHCALKNVSSTINEALIVKTITDTAQFLKQFLKIKKPKIAVLGLNPHAGEDNVLGEEENATIIPGMEMARLKNTPVHITGPHSADSFFAIEQRKVAQKKADKHDAVIAMYHDQGLIPVKTLGFHESINLTLGLPIIRTSVDHGTAFDIAGKNKANAESMILAINTAIKLLGERA